MPADVSQPLPLRLAVGLFAFGFVIARFGLFLEELGLVSPLHTRLGGQHSLLLGLAFVAGGILLAVLAFSHYLAIERDIERGLVQSHRRLVYVVVALCLAAGCRSDPIFSDMSDSTYVRTMVALRRLPVGNVDSAYRARLTDSVLRTFEVTAAQLESTSVRLSNDPARAAEIWRAIEQAPTTPP